jgi:hypothetical protein
VWAGALFLLVCLQTAGPRAQPGGQPTPASGSINRTLIDKYCVSCHNERLKTAGLALDRADLANLAQDRSTWEKVVRKLRAGAMPPVGLPRPDAASVRTLVTALEQSLDAAAATRPDPGRPVIHRLNRAEYANAIRDLLEVEIDPRAYLPADDAGEQGFDNIADVLSVSPALLDGYMSAARKIARIAVGRPTAGPVVQTYVVPRLLVQDGRMSNDLPFGSHGGTAIRHHFPVDGEYVVKIKLRTNLYDYIRGLGRPHRLEVRLDGERVASFVVGGEDKGSPAPASFAGAIFGSPEWERYTHEADEALNAKFPAKAGTRVVGISFAGESRSAAEGVLQPPQIGYPLAIDEMSMGTPAIEQVDVGGPYETMGPGTTASRRKLLPCRGTTPAAERACARSTLSALARQAYRRPATDADVATLLEFYDAGTKDGGFEPGIQLALERLLTDPEFLFRVEQDPPNAAPGREYRISDLELASRLSFFLWSSIPDDELLTLAERRRLSDPAVLERQIRRLLANPRARRALVDNFAGQWLELRNVREHTPDPDVFDEFDENLREALRHETELFIDDQLAGDRSVVDLVAADYTFVNERLARHYGIPNVYGERFRKVTLTGEATRGGLLGHGSLLMVTSYPNRTSPVLRGKFVLGNLLGAPPPPPPPDVPALKDKAEDGRLVSVRERLQEHRKNAVCASCHAQMDPIGFALEPFDATGRWRTTDIGGSALDASGSLPDGSKFQGPSGLRALIVSRRQEFVQTVTEKLLTYALGRRLEYYDLPVVRKIVRDAAATDYRWSSIVIGIVNSPPFRMRRAES